MVLTLLLGNKHNAMTDGYKNIMNSFLCKTDTVCIIPSAYSCDEFSCGFSEIIKEYITSSEMKFYKSIKFALELRKVVIRKKVKTIFFYHEHHWFNLVLYCILFGLKIKFIAWIHDPTLHLGESTKNKFIRYLNKLVLFDHFSKIIVSYRGAMDELYDNYKIKSTNISVLYLPEMLEMQFSDLVSQTSIENYDLIFYGRIERYKGLNLLLQAMENLEKIKLLIVGSGKDSEEIKKKVVGLSNVVFINDYIDNYILAEYIAKSKWVILPYETATGSQTIQIANYYNKPVIVTPVGCFKEYVEEMKNGIFISEYSCEGIIETINRASYINPEIFHDTIKAHFINMFSIKKIVGQLEAILKQD